MGKLIIWRKEYNTGVPEIDRQHMKLVGLINDLIEAGHKNSEFEVLRKVLFEIVDYTKYHFKSEEELLHDVDYPGIHEHHSQHQVLIKQIVQILEDIREGKIDIQNDLLHILENWFIKHVIVHDKDYSSYIEESHPGRIDKRYNVRD